MVCGGSGEASRKMGNHGDLEMHTQVHYLELCHRVLTEIARDPA